MAQKTVEASSTMIDFDNCGKEPIHIPGRTQNFGVLLNLRESDLTIKQIGGNAERFFALSAVELIGQPLKLIFSEDELTKLRNLIRPNDFENVEPIVFSDPKTKSQSLTGLLHRFRGELILEIERAQKEESQATSGRLAEVAKAVSRIQKSRTLSALLQTTAAEIKALTRSNGVMIYRFHPDDHGEVVAETKDTEFESYMGLHYPASDIPPQARALFLLNWVRHIADVSYQSSEIINSGHSADRTPLDLSRSALRSVSPIHIEYLKNMQVKSSLTISLIKDGKLWGLVACHSYSEPRLMTADVRMACEIIGRMASAEISITIEQEKLYRRESLRQLRDNLTTAMNQTGDIVSGLFNESKSLLNLVGASGAAAAMYFEGAWQIAGQTPSITEMNGITEWLSKNHQDEIVFESDRLPMLYPPAKDFKDMASGLLAVSLPKGDRSYLLWFKPEVLTTVTWAGNPDKAGTLTEGSSQIHPRTSFAGWKESVRLRSTPWMSWEIEEVIELRNSILGLELNRQFLKEKSARKDAELANFQKEELLAAVSHDLKNPLGSLRLSLELLKKLLSAEVQGKVFSILTAMKSSTDLMNRLITDLLSIAKIESGTFILEKKSTSAKQILSEMLELHLPLAQEQGIKLTMETCSNDLVAHCDRERIFQVLSNLIGNSIKFTPPDGSVNLQVSEVGSELIFTVKDSGVGIPKDDLVLVFDRFWQARKNQRRGSGLGLAIAKGIVESHGGRIWVESVINHGSSFRFSLPNARFLVGRVRSY